MAGNADRIVPIVQVKPRHIATAIRTISETLDKADYFGPVYVGPNIGTDLTLPEQCYAWMMAAILIASTAEMDGMTLRSLQNSIWKGEQVEFPF